MEDKKFIYESLSEKDLNRDNYGNFAACEGLWQPVSEDAVKTIMERVKACFATDAELRKKDAGYVGTARSAEDYEWENVKKRLYAGKVVDAMICLFRKIEPDAPKCPTCGCSILDSGCHHPLSHRLYCTDCGNRIIRELSGAEGKVRIYVDSIHVTYVNKALYSAFCSEIGLTNFPAWVKELAEEDFDISLTDEESVDQLKAAVTGAAYDSIREWLQYHMRLELGVE